MSDFDLHELISAPIIAMNEAEAENSIRYVELLESYAFDAPKKAGDAPSLSTLAFTYARAEPDGTASLQSVEIPLIQFLPISGVAIDHATLNYALKINPQADKSSGKLRMFGRLAENIQADSPLSGNINIELHLKQVDVPQGVLSLLESTQQAAQQKTISVKPEEPLPVSEPVVEIPDKFVEFDVVKAPAKSIRAGQDYEYVLRTDFVKELLDRDAEVLLTLGAQPRAALNFEGQEGRIIRHGEDFKIQFLASPRIENYKSTTKLKLTLTASHKLSNGEIITYQHNIDLRRAKTIGEK